jgi:uncharacterized Zn-binding protein involved in type VI secretion
MHTCPMVNPGPVPHVGGPVLTGAPTVIIGYIPAARVSDNLICVPSVDSISQGSSNVVIVNKNAARIGDPTNHGGVIVAGCPTVIIGETGQSFSLKGAAASGAPFCEECEKAKEAAEKLAAIEAGQDPPPPPARLPADSITVTTAQQANLAPATVPAPATPWSPTPDEAALAASPGDSPAQRAAREKVLRDFYERYASDGMGQARADQDMGVGGKPPRPNGSPLGYGIDLSLPLQVVKFPPPATMDQYTRATGPYAGKPGNFFDPVGGQSGDALGLNADPALRKAVTFKMPPGEGLFSGNGPIIDAWTDKDKALLTKGGGKQVTVPNSVKNAATCTCCGKTQCGR